MTPLNSHTPNNYVESGRAAQEVGNDFSCFYRAMGFNEYPFALYTAETEYNRQEALFIKPTYYGPIAENLGAFCSMFLVGERGTGKTALIYDLKRSAEKKNIVVLIDDFSSIDISYKPVDLYYLILQRLADKIFGNIFNNKKILRRLLHSDRLLLSYIYSEFASPTTKAELLRRVDELQQGWQTRTLKYMYNILRFPLNFAASAGVNIATDALSKALGNVQLQPNEKDVREYFPDLPFKSDTSFKDIKASLRLLERTSQLIEKLGLGRTVVVLDKLDEDQRLEGDAERIAEFIKPLVNDSNLLLSNVIQIIGSIWSVPFTLLKKENVRTQKISVEMLSWEREDLKRALNNRLQIFSSGKIVNLEMILSHEVTEEMKDKIFLLSNKNPRDLWHAINAILREQFRIDGMSTSVSAKGVDAGLRTFVQKFNYYEYYPRRTGARSNTMDVYAYIRLLLRLSNKEFTRNQLTEKAGVSGQAVNNYVNVMQNMGLISNLGQTGGATVYCIRDPKVVFALENSLMIVTDNS